MLTNRVKQHVRPLCHAVDIRYHAVHTPLEVDEKYSSPYVSLVSDRDRQVLGGMISAVDAGLSAIVERMKARGMWDNTLLIFTTDNGDDSPTPLTYSLSTSLW